MGLYHFYWNGKERTVAVTKKANSLTLLFIDDEIVQAGLTKISIVPGEPLQDLLEDWDPETQRRLTEILTAVQERLGFVPFS